MNKHEFTNKYAFFRGFFMELVILYFLDLCMFLLISLLLLKTGVKNLQRYDLPTAMNGKLFSFIM